MDYYPSLLLIHARQVRGVSGLDADELREIAAEHWPSMGAEWIDRIVRRAIEQRDSEQRRIDPATVDLQHPRAREAMTVATTANIQKRIRTELQERPEATNDELYEAVHEQFPGVSRRQLGINAGHVRREMEAQPSTNGNGAKPEPSNEGGDQHAEPVSPAGEEDGEEAQGSGIAEPEQDPAPDAAPVESARDRLRKYAEMCMRSKLAEGMAVVGVASAAERDRLEEQLIAELTANVNHADVEKRATELDQLADTLRQRTEGLLNALSREGAEA